jgi:hypothetical protein
VFYSLRLNALLDLEVEAPLHDGLLRDHEATPDPIATRD